MGFSDSTIDYFYLKPEQDFQLSVKELCIALSQKQIDFLILCNPNNPTSSALFRPELIELLTFCRDFNIFVMIDETYVEFAPDIHAVSAVSLNPGLSEPDGAARCFQIFSQLPNAIGYGITGGCRIPQKIERQTDSMVLKQSWRICRELLFQDDDYIKKTRNLILSEREYMYTKLRELPFFHVYPAYANFILLQIQKDGLTSFSVFESCIQEGLMIRDCSSFSGLDGEFVRFCIMHPTDNRKLLAVFQKISQSDFL